MHAYVSYQLNSKTALDMFDEPEFSVRRRFKDFVWLYDVLKAENAGYIIPPLPDKSLYGRFSSTFIESRRRALFKFVSRVAQHPVLSRRDVFIHFLQDKDDVLETYKTAKNAARPYSIMSVFSSISNSITRSFNQVGNSVVATTPGGVPVPLAPQSIYEEHRAYVTEVRSELMNLRKTTEAMTRRRIDFSGAETDFGQALLLLGGAESTSRHPRAAAAPGQGAGDAAHDPLATALGEMGKTAEALAALERKQADSEAAFFEDPIAELVGVTDAALEMLQNGDDCHVQFLEATMTLELKKHKLQMARAEDTRSDKLDSMQDGVNAALTDVQVAKDQHSAMQESIEGEMARFKAEKTEEFRKILHNFVNLQINHTYKMLYSWQSIIPHIEMISN